MEYESFIHELHQVQSQTSMLVAGAKSAAPPDPAAVEQVLAELDTIATELHAADEEVRVLNDQLATTQEALSAERDRYRDLFQFAPAAYLLTDRFGIIREVNRRAASLFGIPRHFLIGRPLAMLVPDEDRRALRDHLNRLNAPDAAAWQLRVLPRDRKAVAVAASAGAVRDQTGAVTEVRWQLLELPSASDRTAEATAATKSRLFPPLLRQPANSQPAGNPVLTPVLSLASDWDDLTGTLQRVVHTAVPLLRADGAGVMLADHDGTLHVVTGTDQAAQTFQRAEQDLGEGPCIDAFARTKAVRTNDLWTDPRWPRLGPAARINQIRGVLSVPIINSGRTKGTCNALATSPHTWTDVDVDAIRAYAALLAQLIGSASDARNRGELATQLQAALDSRVLIEQAKGVLMERHGLDEQAAFARLRRWARSSSHKVAEVAREVIADARR